MLCNNTQFYEWHPVYPIRGWTFAWRVGPKGYTVMGGEFHPGAKWTKKQMRRKKKEARKVARQQKLTAERIPDHRPVTNLKFKHARFPYQHRETSPRCRVHNYRVKKEDVPAMIAAGYRRTSRKFLGLCRIDRPDWREYMAFQHAPWDPAGEGMNWANSEGYVAGEHGASRSANPYPRGHFLHDAWLDGRDEADRREPQLTGLEKFVILVLIAFGTALVCLGIFWLLVFLS